MEPMGWWISSRQRALPSQIFPSWMTSSCKPSKTTRLRACTLNCLNRLLDDEEHSAAASYPDPLQILQNRLSKRPFRKYHNRLIDAKEVIEQMIAIEQQMDAETQRAQEPGLSGEEMAFDHVVASNFLTIYDQKLLRELSSRSCANIEKRT